MDSSKQSGPSHLFLLRTWAEDGSEQEGSWWARVQHIFTGEARTFRVNPELTDVLLELLDAPYPAQQAHEDREE